MFVGFDSGLHVHNCFPHYKNLVECLDSSLLRRKICTPYASDFEECVNKTKHVVSIDPD